ncbi:MAG: hypothetical protein HRU11_15005, partial [Parvularculaceae bacterium]|nr:hypothetical protein [Parvularculaceae bacterium]
MTVRLVTYFVLFGLLPGLAYQFVQDDLRVWAAEAGSNLVALYLLGIAPNFLGGVSLTASMGAIAREGSLGQHSWLTLEVVAIVALLGLWVWEFGQKWFPNGTFDGHDL